MTKFFKLPRYHWLTVFAFCGGFVIAFAFSSYNLFHLAKSNVHFLQDHGWFAIQEGALFQSVQILIGSCFSLFCFLGFKFCESELISRYNHWKQK